MIAAALVSLLAALQPGKMPKLEYFRGRVLQKVHVVPVLWGPNVDPATVSGIAGFYGAATGALSWLDAEYGAPVGKSIQNGDSEPARQIGPAPSLLPGANG